MRIIFFSHSRLLITFVCAYIALRLRWLLRGRIRISLSLLGYLVWILTLSLLCSLPLLFWFVQDSMRRNLYLDFLSLLNIFVWSLRIILKILLFTKRNLLFYLNPPIFRLFFSYRLFLHFSYLLYSGTKWSRRFFLLTFSLAIRRLIRSLFIINHLSELFIYLSKPIILNLSA